MTFRLACLALIVSLALTAVTVIITVQPVSALEEWDVTLVEANDSPTTLYGTTSIALDSLGKPNICYRICGESSSTWFSVKHAALQSDTWDVSFVDGGGNGFTTLPTSIAIDTEGIIHLGYSNVTDGESLVRYANNSAGDWTITDISDGKGIGTMCVDSQGITHMCYAVRVGLVDALAYATNAGGAWTSEIIDDLNHTMHASIALDSDDQVHIAYTIYDGDYSVLYATNADGAWNPSLVDFGRYGAIAVDPTGNPHVVYVGEDIDQTAIKCAERNGESWWNSTVDIAESTDWSPSITIDTEDRTHVSYSTQTASSSTLMHAVETDDEWVNSVVEHFEADQPFLGRSSIVVGTSGDVHISYMRGQGSSHDDGGGLKYATAQTLVIPELSPLALPLVVMATVAAFLALSRTRRP